MTTLQTILDAAARLRTAKQSTADLPPVGTFEATVTRLAARAEVAPPVLVWSLDVAVSK